MTKIRNTNIGLTLLLMSAIIYAATLISASVYSPIVREQGWSSRVGLFGTALREVGTIPIIIAVVLGIAGIFLIVISNNLKSVERSE